MGEGTLARSSGHPAAAQGAGGTWHEPLWPAGSLTRTTPAAKSSGLFPSGERGRGAMGEVSKQAQGTAEGGAFASGAKGKVLQETRTENERKRQVNGFMD